MTKTLTLTFIVLMIVACGGTDQSKETQFYKKQQTVAETLEVSIEASGVIAVSYTHLTLPTKA